MVAMLSGECYGESVPSGPMGRLAEWPAGRGYFQRFAACHACRRWRFLTLFSDVRPRLHRRRAGAAADSAATGNASNAAAGGVACYRLRRRGGGVSAADRAGATACDVRAFDGVHRTVAAGDGTFRRTARRRAPPPGLLDLLINGKHAGGRFCSHR